MLYALDQMDCNVPTPGRIGGYMQRKDNEVQTPFIPWFSTLRRVPTRYQRVLPLGVMKRYRCIIVGEARGVYTVALATHQDIVVIGLLRRLTGHKIFPVLVDTDRMRLLIQRLERTAGCKRTLFGFPYVLQQRQLHSMLLFLGGY